MEAIEWSDGTVLIVDGRLLSGKRVYHICRDYPEVSEAIRTDAIRDSSILGVAVAMGIALGAQRSQAKTVEEFDREFEDICTAMMEARPGNQNIASVVRQFRSTYLKYRPNGILVVRISLVLEALLLQAEKSASGHTVHKDSGGEVESACAPSNYPPDIRLRGYHFR